MLIRSLRQSLTATRSRRGAGKKAPSKTRRLRHEPLEERQMLAVYSSGVETLIPDPGTAMSEISVSSVALIQDLDVQLTVEHTKAEDLDVYLIAPDGTRVELFTDVGARGDDFLGTILSDEAATPITSGSAPFSGEYRPEGDLSALEGKSLAGIWTLEVTDDKRRESGTLKSWSMSVTEITNPADEDFLDTNPLMLGDAYNLTPAPEGYDIVVAENGDAMAVWIESEGSGQTGPWRAMAARYDAATDTWETPEIISTTMPSISGTNWLNIAGDGRGNYIAVWQDSSEYEILAKSYVASSGWQASTSIGGEAYNYTPEVAMVYDADNDVSKAVVAFRSDSDGAVQLYTNRMDDFSTGIWSDPSLAADVMNIGYPIALEMASDGDFLMVFHTGDIYYRHYDSGTGWTSDASLVESNDAHALWPHMDMNSNGEAMLVWNQKTGIDDAYEVWGRRWDGEAWQSEAEVINDDPGYTALAWYDVAIDDSGRAYATYRQQRGASTYYDAYVREHDGTNWATNTDGSAAIIQLDSEDMGDVAPGTLASKQQSYLQITTDASGNAVATWKQDDGTYVNLWAAQKDAETGTWGSAFKVEDADLNIYQPVLDTNASGDSQILWFQSDGLQMHAYAYAISGSDNMSPIAAPDFASIAEDTAIVISNRDLLLNDSDPELDPIRVSSVGQGDNGSVVDNGDGTLTYTPNADFNGVDAFTYTITDDRGGTDTATVSIMVAPVPDDPIAVDDSAITDVDIEVTVQVLDNDTDADNDTLTVDEVGVASPPQHGTVVSNRDSVTYRPDTGYVGTDTFSYMVSDGNGGTDTGIVTITVSEPSSDIALYVYDISFVQHGRKADWWQAVFQIRADADGNGVGGNDTAGAGVAITVNFAGQTFSGTTDSNGVFTTDWVKKLQTGTNYYANVVDMALSGYIWDRLLDLEDDSDGDGDPDNTLNF